MLNFGIKKGFTLTEVLVTLGIIGIVAAMTLPILIKKHEQKVTVTKLQKIYSLLNQAYNMSILDNGDLSSWSISNSSSPIEYVQKYWLKYIKNAVLCNTYSECGYSKNRPWVDRNNNVSQEDVTGTSKRMAIKLVDGTVIAFRIPNNNGDIPINIDINGAKGPNRVARDYFCIYLRQAGVQAKGLDNDYDSINNSCINNSSYDYCITKIIKDSWQIKKDYPW